MAKRKITKKEVRGRLGYLFLTFFAVYLLDPFYSMTDNLISTPFAKIITGVIGILATLWFFDF